MEAEMFGDRKRQFLVLGGTGKTGKRVARRLKARGYGVRIGSRSATPAFDWDAPKTWDACLKGVDAVYVSFQPDLAVPGAPEVIGAFAKRAAKKGARRLVLLSGRGEPEAEACEAALKSAGAEWTILRCAWFAQNFSENFFADGVAAGELALPVGDVKEPFVDVEDIADVAVAALIEDAHAGKTYDLTGPRLLSFADAVAEIAAASGRDIAFLSAPLEPYVAALRAQGLDEGTIALIRYLFTSVLDGRNAKLGDGVMSALGRPPRDFSDYARAAFAREAAR